jgi:serine/threonine-protein kinase
MATQQSLLEPGTEVSRYRIEELVARGGMGLVYRARDLRLDRPVALKVLSPELSEDDAFRTRFVRECRIAASLGHPHVVPVYEADDWHGLLYIAMRFVQGADLHTVLTGGPLELDAALLLLTQAASALDAAHEAGLVHRDVKPGNFLVAGAAAGSVPGGAHLYLTDFGLTKRTSSLSGLTRTGQFLGSLHYVAPEQIRGEEVDGRADTYALACVAYELLTGRPPFPREQEAALLWAHMSVPPPELGELRADLPPALGSGRTRDGQGPGRAACLLRCPGRGALRRGGRDGGRPHGADPRAGVGDGGRTDGHAGRAARGHACPRGLRGRTGARSTRRPGAAAPVAAAGGRAGGGRRGRGRTGGVVPLERR